MAAPMINDVRTGGTPEYPDIQPQRFERTPDEVFAAVARLAPAQVGWGSIQSDAAKRTLRAVAKTRLLRFRDDVWIEVVPEGEGSAVQMRSKSRLGKGDLGVNARRIRGFQAQMAAELEGAK